MPSAATIGGIGRGLAKGEELEQADRELAIKERSQILGTKDDWIRRANNLKAETSSNFTELVAKAGGGEALAKETEKLNYLIGVYGPIDSAINALAERGDSPPISDFVGQLRTMAATAQTAAERGAGAGAEKLGEAAATLGVTPEKLSDRQRAELAGTGTVDVQKSLTDAAQFAIRSLEGGLDPVVVSESLRSVANANRDNPGIVAGLDALEAALPKTLEEFERGKTERDIAASRPIIDALKAAGVPDDLAAILTLGRGGAQLAVEPSTLTKANLTAFQRDLADIRQLRTSLVGTLPLINENTVGIWQAISTGAGAIMQQLPGVRDIADAIGEGLGLDRKSVKAALVARSDMMTTVARLASFIKGRGGRIAVQDREFAAEASALLSLATTAEAAQDIVNRMIGMADALIDDINASIESGSITPPAGNKTVVPLGGGRFEVRDEAGNVVQIIEPVQ